MNQPAVPPLNQLYFYLTAGCNLRCRHCWIAPKYQEQGGREWPSLPYELFTEILTQAKPLGLAGVKLTGGEPLLHPRIEAIIAHVQEQELRLTIETNGVLCTAGLARLIAQSKGAFVSVSLDGADAATHEWVRGVAGSHAATLAGLRHLVEAGLRPQVIMTVMRRNVEQMEPLVRLVESLGAGSVKFNVMQPMARGEGMHAQDGALDIAELIALGQKVEHELAPSTPLRLYFDHPMAFRPLSRMFGANGDGCGRCGILGILGVLSSGRYALCGVGEQVPEMVFGDARHDRLETIWRANPVLDRLRTGMPEMLEGICGDCLMKNLCLGSCIAQNYYRNRSLWAPFWFCERARELGLFPAQRRATQGG